MTVGTKDTNQHFLVVHGLGSDEDLKAIFDHFRTNKGGAAPSDLARYASVPVSIDDIVPALEWITKNLRGRYSSLRLNICNSPGLSWAEVSMTPEIVSALAAHGAGASITFGSSRFSITINKGRASHASAASKL